MLNSAALRRAPGDQESVGWSPFAIMRALNSQHGADWLGRSCVARRAPNNKEDAEQVGKRQEALEAPSVRHGTGRKKDTRVSKRASNNQESVE